MSQSISSNTKATLLLTAPLIIGRNTESPRPLTLREYKRLKNRLSKFKLEPADLFDDSSAKVIEACSDIIETSRLRDLLNRGFQLTTALNRWRKLSIWVISHADLKYPGRLKRHLKENAPPILYGIGEFDLLNLGGLAVVGSRRVDSSLVQYAMNIGRQCAHAGKTVITGGAKGIDKAAMRGALEAGGAVIGVLANNLASAALQRDYRNSILANRLVLVSPYDPYADFNVGNAMGRNKLIYAFADAGLVVNCDFNKGGTWNGAVEQVDKLKFVPLYVRATGQLGEGLKALRDKGARPWPEPQDYKELLKIFSTSPSVDRQLHNSCPEGTEAHSEENASIQPKLPL